MMSFTENIEHAEHLLRVAEENLATAQGQSDYRRVKQMVQLAQGHAMLAQAKRWAKP